MKTIRKMLAALMFLICCLGGIYTTTSNAATVSSKYRANTGELRAIWVSNFAGDLESYQSEEQYKSDITKMLDNFDKWGINAVMFHVRTHNNALYDSDLNPLASWWEKVDFAIFDPLTWTIDECHKRGIEFHAWMNPYRLGTNYTTGSTPKENPINKKKNILEAGSGPILDPAIPENRDFIVNTCLEVIEKYDVDAIHFDDYFYADGVNDTESRNKYNTENLSLADFRRKQVDLFIEQLSKSMDEYNEANNRYVQLGISPSGIYNNGIYPENTIPTYDDNGTLTYPNFSNSTGFSHYGPYLYSDTKKWIDEEWIDYITPQAYNDIATTAASFTKLTEWWSWVVRHKNVNLYMGQGVYKAYENNTTWKDVNEFENELLVGNAKREVSGFSIFKYVSLMSTTNAVVKQTKAVMEAYWGAKKVPGALVKSLQNAPKPLVTNTKVVDNQISWDEVEGVRGYGVWLVPSSATLDTTDFSQFVAYVNTNSYEFTKTGDYYITTVNKANDYSKGVLVTTDPATLALKTQALTEVEDYYKSQTMPNSYLEEVTNVYNSIIEKINSTRNPVSFEEEIALFKKRLSATIALIEYSRVNELTTSGINKVERLFKKVFGQIAIGTLPAIEKAVADSKAELDEIIAGYLKPVEKTCEEDPTQEKCKVTPPAEVTCEEDPTQEKCKVTPPAEVTCEEDPTQEKCKVTPPAEVTCEEDPTQEKCKTAEPKKGCKKKDTSVVILMSSISLGGLLCLILKKRDN